MQKLENKNSIPLEDASTLYYSGATEAGIYEADELWCTSLKLTKKKELKVSLFEKKEWNPYSITKLNEQEEEGEQVFVEVPNLENGTPFDTRLDFIFQGAFFGSLLNTAKDNVIIKLIPVVLFFLFGSLGTLFSSYLVIACFCILLGVTKDIIKKKFSVPRVNRAIFEQIYMLLGIGILNVFIKGLIDKKFLGEFSSPLMDILILWFFANNFLSTIKYLSLLGVPLPKTLKPKIEAIKTILD